MSEENAKKIIEDLTGLGTNMEGMYKIEEIGKQENGRREYKKIKGKKDGVYFVVGKMKDIGKLSEETEGATEKVKKNGEDKDKVFRGEELVCLQNKLNKLKENAKNRHEDWIILYIGKATRKNKDGLYERIREYIKWGYGEGNNHAGGRAIWQIPNSKKILYFCWIELNDKKASEDMEAKLIAKYAEKYGDIPYANRKREK